MSEPKEPIHGSADGGVRSRWRSEADRLEEEVRIAEWRSAEAERERAARARLAEITAAATPAPTAARHGGPVPAADSRERIVDEAIAQREPDGTWPTQAAVAGTLRVTDRRVRQVQGKAGWAGIIEDAKVKARDR